MIRIILCIVIVGLLISLNLQYSGYKIEPKPKPDPDLYFTDNELNLLQSVKGVMKASYNRKEHINEIENHVRNCLEYSTRSPGLDAGDIKKIIKTCHENAYEMYDASYGSYMDSFVTDVNGKGYDYILKKERRIDEYNKSKAKEPGTN